MQQIIYKSFVAVIVYIFIATSVNAQLKLTGQLRTRTELRQGQGTLPEPGAVPAFFTSQRTRVNLAYSGYRLNLFSSLQNVSVWGQETSTINRTTSQEINALMFHQAWAEIFLLDTSSKIGELSLKIGRQELAYNDHRLLGNLDWLQQGRRHDIAVIKFSSKGWSVDAGAGYNQNKESKSGSVYISDPSSYPAGTNGMRSMYKSLQFLFINKKWNWGNTSWLTIKDDFNKYSLSGSVKNFERGVWSRLTSGYHLEAMPLKNFSCTNTVYYQTGKDKNGKKLAAMLVSLATNYKLNDKINIGPGVDFTTGNNGLKQSEKSYAFDPLYGTPHKFWGFMDYFYVADGFGDAGLTNYYLKSKLQINKKLSTSLDIHEFYSSNVIVNNDGTSKMNPRLGTEFDFVTNFKFTNTVSLEAGYGIFFGTKTLDRVKEPAIDNKNIGHWGYLMINITPGLLNTASTK